MDVVTNHRVVGGVILVHNLTDAIAYWKTWILWEAGVPYGPNVFRMYELKVKGFIKDDFAVLQRAGEFRTNPSRELLRFVPQ